MMKAIGIDVSKLHLDLALLDQDGKVLQEAHISNKASCLRKLLRSGLRANALRPYAGVSGTYRALQLRGDQDHVGRGCAGVAGTSGGYQEQPGHDPGKSDQVDARRIAQYALRFGDKARFLDETFLHLQEWKDLLAARDQSVRERAKHRRQQGDQLKAMQGRAKACFKRCSDNTIAALTRSIAYVEKQVEAF
ncbi:MAG: transposase [Flavobacteriales bacterium]|nr:transposase [Flavobacteriales bacterium]